MSDAFVIDASQRIQSIYGIEPDDFFQLKKTHSPNNYWPLDRLSHHKPEEIHSFGKFRFAKYQSRTKAEEAIQSLVEFVNNGYPILSIDDFNSPKEIIFGKGGSTFTLKDQYIIQKSNQCMSSYENSVTFADSLRDSYYPNGIPEHYHFVRDCCACSQDMRITIE